MTRVTVLYFDFASLRDAAGIASTASANWWRGSV